MSTFLQRLAQYKEICELSRDAMGEKLGVTGRYIGMIERGEKEVDDDSTISKLLDLLITESRRNYVSEDPGKYIVGESPKKRGAPTQSNARILGPVNEIFTATVPVISWAHAGTATSYEELPEHWQERIPTLCKGKRAFGLVIEGDSMVPRCEPNDVVVVDPDAELRNGCLVVAKLRDDGVVLRRFTRLEVGRVKLIPYNSLYPSVEYSLSAFHWIYLVHSSFRRELL